MNRRERVIRAVELRRPDRCPIIHDYLPAAMLRHGQALVDLLKRYPNDFGSSDHSVPKIEDLPPPYRAGRNTDDWGTVWHSTANGIHGQVVEYPIHTWEEAEAYQFPTLPGDAEIESRREEVARFKKQLFVRAGFNPGNYFERLQWLMGFRSVLTNLVRQPRGFVDFADRLLDYCLASLSRVLETEPDCVAFGDDWGAQDRLLIRPEIWHSFFRPRYKRMFDLVHDHGACVQFHSDGYITDIIQDLYEIGVNVLNPQFSCHDLEDLAERVRGKICILSDVDRQILLPHGTPDQIDSYVGYMVKIFGRQNDGGLIGRGELNMDVPLENVKSLYDSFLKHGRYDWT